MLGLCLIFAVACAVISMFVLPNNPVGAGATALIGILWIFIGVTVQSVWRQSRSRPPE